MKTHVLSQCERAPLDKKQQLIRYEAEKVRAKKEKEAAEAEAEAEAAAASENHIEVGNRAQEEVLSKIREQPSPNSSTGVTTAVPTNGAVQKEPGPSAAKKQKREHVPVLTAHHGPPPPQTTFAP